MSKLSMGKAYKLLEWIRKNTDREHSVTQAKLREMMGEDLSNEIMGDKGTYARRLHEIADAYNTDDAGNVLPENQWKIVYPGYQQGKGTGRKNGRVYYSQPVSCVEMDFLISSIRKTNNFTVTEKESLENRLKDALCSKYYEYPEDEPEGIIWDLSLLQQNREVNATTSNTICLLRDYICKHMMVNIRVRDTVFPEEKGDDQSIEPDDKRERTDDSDALKCTWHQVSPYRLLYAQGHYWLIGNEHERPANTFSDYDLYQSTYKRRCPWYTDKLTAYRIDLITNVDKAYVEPTTHVHYMMSWNIPTGVSYERNNAERPRKARYNVNMIANLAEFDKVAPKLTYSHLQDLEIGEK